ncbi:septum-associated rare lipoprotein A [Synechococcus phage B3]|nr:septum-associated rare lipoprotein A [Synechococcus phage B3]QGT54966.1 septum-associated rare lipoprotein A [Synechococcus phage B23]
MLFNNKILTSIVCGTIGATALSPIPTQAISVTSSIESMTAPAKSQDWYLKLEKVLPNYKAPTASAQYGNASWYGPGFYGNRTANGEVYRPGSMTAAHKYLPFGTRVLVTNLNNGRSAVLRINDRGPFYGGRIIDLSETAAGVLGLKSPGVGPVKVKVLN